MASGERRSVDPQVWKACAGSSVRVPPVDSLVYYFPQGHAEQAWSPPDFSVVWCRKPFYFLCRVADVQLLANRDTDEVYARIRLVPVGSPLAPPMGAVPADEDPAEEAGVVSFAKVLTPSDANNGGGFSVPRFCADSIFPPLNYGDEPPVQTISVRDVHGVVWEFRHIYRGTPRRHLLTTGWSKFVNSKKLIAGDSVVFVKDMMDDLFIGVQRAGRSSGSVDYSRYGAALASSVVKLEDGSGGSGEGFSRNSRGKMSPESVVEAVREVVMGRPFEVVYYPRAGSPEFVVRAEAVDTAMNVYWRSGVRVKMAVESDESSRTSWHQGTVNCTKPLNAEPFSCSPWRMLQVAWDEPDLLHAKSVSPWQVEIIPATPPIPSPYPPIKRLRPQHSEPLTDATNFNKMMTGSAIASPFGYNTPAGMQGARQDPVCVSGLSTVETKSSQCVYLECPKDIPVQQKRNHVSTELSIGNSSHSGSSSPPSQNSVLYNTPYSFQLFGKTIHTEQPVDYSAATNYVETEGMTDAHSFSHTFKPKELYGVRNQRVSAVEACST